MITEINFQNSDIHFVSKESQDEDGTAASNILVLLYQQVCLFTQQVQHDMVNVDPPDTGNHLLFCFPFDVEGTYMEKVVIPEDDWMFAHPAFKSGSSYPLRNSTKACSTETLFREEGMYDGLFDSVDVTTEDLASLKRSEPFRDVHADFWSCWMLRHMDGDVSNDVLIDRYRYAEVSLLA